MSYRDYSDQDVVSAVKNSNSIAGVIKKLGLVPAGGNYETVKRKIEQLNLDISHFTGKAWIPKGTQKKPFDQLVGITVIKTRLIAERGHQCQSCQRMEWLDQQIVLELDHIDGNRLNNGRDNLRLLCPNCHAQTSTWRRRKTALVNQDKIC